MGNKKTLCTFEKHFVNRVRSKRKIVKAVNLAVYNLDIIDRGFCEHLKNAVISRKCIENVKCKNGRRKCAETKVDFFNIFFLLLWSVPHVSIRFTDARY